ncbi:MAG TPA: sigma factor-like helix-turn-helix DNA-binding protein [Gemmataceae bacterium]|nr:sigma factor-like helix-turn-helix DNA-binding protein [Gemmataceae bacterium]
MATPRQAESTDAAWRELCAVLDEELQSLPAKFREPLLLCYLEGRTTDEAAKELDWSLRTLKRRLEQGRERLRMRLTRRGLTLSLAMLSAGLVPQASAVPAVLTATTVKAAVEFAARVRQGSASTAVVHLAEGILKSSAARRVNLSAAVLLITSLVAAGTGAAIHHALTASGEPANHVTRTESPGLAGNDEADTVIVGDKLPEGVLVRLGTQQWRHHHSTADLAVAFSPNGELLSTGGAGSTRLWQTATGKLLFTFRGNYGHGLFSPDGKWLALDNGRLVDVTSGREIQRFSSPGSPIAFSSDARLLAAGNRRDRSLSIWRTATGEEIARLRGNQASIHSGAFSQGGSTLLTMGWERGLMTSLCYWDVASGKLSKSVDTGDWRKRRVYLSPDGGTLAVSPNSKGGTSLLEAQTRAERCELKGEHNYGRSVVFSSDGRYLATEWRDGAQAKTEMSVWDTGTGKLLHRLTLPVEAIYGFALCSDGRTLVTSGAEARVRLWDLAAGRPLPEEAGHNGEVYNLSFTPDGSTLISSAGDGSIRVWDIATGRQVHECDGPAIGVGAIAALPDGKTFLAAGSDDLIHVRDLHSGKELRRFAPDKPVEQASPHGHHSTTFTLASDGRNAVSQSAAGKAGLTVHLWDVGTGRAIAHRLETGRLEWSLSSPDAKTMVVIVDTGQGTLAPNVKMPHMKAGGSALRYGNIHVVLQEATTGRRLVTLPQPDNYGHAAFSSDGRMLITSTCRIVPAENGHRWENHRLHLWELASGQERLAIQVGNDELSQVDKITWSTDCRIFATERRDRTIQFWDARTGAELLRYTGYAAPVYCLAFSPDGTKVASGHSDSTILIWDASRASPPHRAQEVSTLRESDNWWTELATADGHAGYAAIWAMVDQADNTVKRLRGRLSPERPFPAEQMRKLIADLDSSRFQEREEAARQLADLEERAEPALREALKTNPSAEQRRRIEALLAVPTVVRSAEKLRRLRALEILEHIGSPQARKVLDGLTKGAPESRVTQEAKASLERLQRRSADSELPSR